MFRILAVVLVGLGVLAGCGGGGQPDVISTRDLRDAFREAGFPRAHAGPAIFPTDARPKRGPKKEIDINIITTTKRTPSIPFYPLAMRFPTIETAEQAVASSNRSLSHLLNNPKAVAAARRSGRIPRDFKPENVKVMRVCNVVGWLGAPGHDRSLDARLDRAFTLLREKCKQG